ncbi:MAG: hypothetical protein M0Q91_16375 [Methanoregula sp.]|nr:hypothetical protein [Methanoregula sp.]
MTGKFSPQYFCCVCGHRITGGSRQELIERGCGTIQGNGSVIWHCPTHSAEDVQKAIHATPTFSTGSQYRKSIINSHQ